MCGSHHGRSLEVCVMLRVSNGQHEAVAGGRGEGKGKKRTFPGEGMDVFWTYLI